MGGTGSAALQMQIADYERKVSDQQAVVDALVTIRVRSFSAQSHAFVHKHHA